MNIELTPREYLTLLEILHMAQVMVSNHEESCDGDDDEAHGCDIDVTEYHNLFQKILGKAKDFGFEDLVEYDEDTDGLVTSEDFEESDYAALFDQYLDECVLSFLVKRIAENQAIEAMGEEAFDELSYEEQVEVCSEYADRFLEDFDGNIMDLILDDY